MSERFAIVLVMHNMERARRITHRTAFFYLGDLVGVGYPTELFENPKEERTGRYMAGIFGWCASGYIVAFDKASVYSVLSDRGCRLKALSHARLRPMLSSGTRPVSDR